MRVNTQKSHYEMQSITPNAFIHTKWSDPHKYGHIDYNPQKKKKKIKKETAQKVEDVLRCISVLMRGKCVCQSSAKKFLNFPF